MIRTTVLLTESYEHSMKAYYELWRHSKPKKPYKESRPITVDYFQSLPHTIT